MAQNSILYYVAKAKD